MSDEHTSDPKEHVCDSNGDVTLAFTPRGFVQRIRCSGCNAIVVEQPK